MKTFAASFSWHFKATVLFFILSVFALPVISLAEVSKSKKSVNSSPQFDPCSAKNYRATLSSPQEADMLQKFKNKCTAKDIDNKKLLQQYLSIKNSMKAQKAGHSFRTAEQKCDDKIKTSINADLDDVNDQVRLQSVKSINEYRGASADVDNWFPQVGQLRYKDRFTNTDVKCNATYVEMSDGRKGFLTAKHCIIDTKSRKWYNNISNFKVHMGFNSENPSSVIDVSEVHCADNGDLPDNTFIPCLLIPREYSNIKIKPMLTRFKSEKEFDSDLKVNNEIIHLVGFHPSRTFKDHGELYDHHGGGPYPPKETRTIQKGRKFKATGYASYTLGRGAALIGHTADTLGDTSGAAVVEWNGYSGEFELVGVHMGTINNRKDKSWINCSVLLPADQFTEITEVPRTP